ncbi:hypothetical protein JFQ93_003982 [Aeromonas sobria]|jgi:hypothetical protein|nr:hypothetical protein [Aeromonas sobria]
MSVPAKPFWLSDAYNEFGGNRWMSDTANRAGLSVPRWLGELAGRSAFLIVQVPQEAFTYGPDARFLVKMDGSNIIGFSEGKGWYQLTVGLCQIRFSLNSWSGSYQNDSYINCSSGVAFTPDATERGVKTNEMFSMGYTSSVFNVEFIVNGVVIAIHSVNCEVESH